MRRLPLAVVISLSLLLGGCSVSGQLVWDQAKQVVISYLTSIFPASSLEKAKNQIVEFCVKARQAEQQAIAIALQLGVNPDTCKARNLVAKERAAFQPICTSVNYLTDDVVGNYYKKVKEGLVKVSKATAVGC